VTLVVASLANLVICSNMSNSFVRCRCELLDSWGLRSAELVLDPLLYG
jgi:hypothetical protein